MERFTVVSWKISVDVIILYSRKTDVEKYTQIQVQNGDLSYFVGIVFNGHDIPLWKYQVPFRNFIFYSGCNR